MKSKTNKKAVVSIALIVSILLSLTTGVFATMEFRYNESSYTSDYNIQKSQLHDTECDKGNHNYFCKRQIPDYNITGDNKLTIINRTGNNKPMLCYREVVQNSETTGKTNVSFNVDQSVLNGNDLWSARYIFLNGDTIVANVSVPTYAEKARATTTFMNELKYTAVIPASGNDSEEHSLFCESTKPVDLDFELNYDTGFLTLKSSTYIGCKIPDYQGLATTKKFTLKDLGYDGYALKKDATGAVVADENGYVSMGTYAGDVFTEVKKIKQNLYNALLENASEAALTTAAGGTMGIPFDTSLPITKVMFFKEWNNSLAIGNNSDDWAVVFDTISMNVNNNVMFNSTFDNGGVIEDYGWVIGEKMGGKFQKSIVYDPHEYRAYNACDGSVGYVMPKGREKEGWEQYAVNFNDIPVANSDKVIFDFSYTQKIINDSGVSLLQQWNPPIHPTIQVRDETGKQIISFSTQNNNNWFYVYPNETNIVEARRKMTYDGAVAPIVAGVNDWTNRDNYYQIVMDIKNKTASFYQLDLKGSGKYNMIFENIPVNNFTTLGSMMFVSTYDRYNKKMEIKDFNIYTIDKDGKKVKTPAFAQNDGTQYATLTTANANTTIKAFAPTQLLQNETATLIIALYDNTGTFVDCKMTPVATISEKYPSGTCLLSLDYQLPSNLAENYKVKAFVWDSITGVVPYDIPTEIVVTP